jgi:regulator of protease activity HflC (stomatin/prohibitin superfamily)
MQLAQTTLRSEMGKIDLDKTFEERNQINMQVVTELDKASEPWGVKVLRYEIKNISPPKDVRTPWRSRCARSGKRAPVILTSEGARDSAINNPRARNSSHQQSEADKQKSINEAEGQAKAILAIAEATAEGIRQVAKSNQEQGGYEAVQLRVAENYIKQFGHMASTPTP